MLFASKEDRITNEILITGESKESMAFGKALEFITIHHRSLHRQLFVI